MFPAYIEHPTNCRFEGQDPDEEILLLLRAHPITNLPWIILSVLVFVIPFAFPKAVSLVGINLGVVPENFLLILVIINYLLVLIIVFEGYLYWYFNVYIITDKNIIDVDFHSILFKNIDIAPLRNIEDVSSSMGGILHSVFNYGDVFIQTAGTTRNIDFNSVPKPHQVADFILDEAHKIYGRGRHASSQPN